jgi:hypothetical protein
LAPQAGFEPATLRLTGGQRSVSRPLRRFAGRCRIALHPSQNPPFFRLRLVPAFAAICRSLLLPKGKKRATSRRKPPEDGVDRVLAKDRCAESITFAGRFHCRCATRKKRPMLPSHPRAIASKGTIGRSVQILGRKEFLRTTGGTCSTGAVTRRLTFLANAAAARSLSRPRGRTRRRAPCRPRGSPSA